MATWLPAVPHLVVGRMNIIKWVCYFSQGCATVVYASATLSLSLYYILLTCVYHIAIKNLAKIYTYFVIPLYNHQITNLP